MQPKLHVRIFRQKLVFYRCFKTCYFVNFIYFFKNEFLLFLFLIRNTKKKLYNNDIAAIIWCSLINNEIEKCPIPPKLKSILLYSIAGFFLIMQTMHARYSRLHIILKEFKIHFKGFFNWGIRVRDDSLSFRFLKNKAEVFLKVER